MTEIKARKAVNSCEDSTVEVGITPESGANPEAMEAFNKAAPDLRMIELEDVDLSLQCVPKAGASRLLKFW